MDYEELKGWMTVHEAAQALGVSKSRVHQMLTRHEIPRDRVRRRGGKGGVGKVVLIEEAYIEEMVALDIDGRRQRMRESRAAV